MNRGWGGCVLFLFREDGSMQSMAQKLENRWNCFNSFAEVVALFWSSMTGSTEWFVKAHQNKIQFRPTDISLLLTVVIRSTLLFFSFVVSVCFVLEMT